MVPFLRLESLNIERIRSLWHISVNLLYSCTKLKKISDMEITTDWPASNPLIPANILIAFVQNTATMPMYT